MKKEKNQEKCENKAISWIKWDVTGGKTVMYASMLNRVDVEGKKGEQNEWGEKITFSRSGVEMDDVHIFDEGKKCVQTAVFLSLYSSFLSEQAIIGTWEIEEITVSWDFYAWIMLNGSCKRGSFGEAKSVWQYKLRN